MISLSFLVRSVQGLFTIDCVVPCGVCVFNSRRFGEANCRTDGILSCLKVNEVVDGLV